MGVIATPTFQYDPHSVWNRNQLGDLTDSPVTLIIMGIVGYYLYKKFIK